jgi:hypothetical protein
VSPPPWQYGYGNFAPGYKGGDVGRYACGHNLLVAHGKTKALYDAKYRTQQVRGRRGCAHGKGRGWHC